MQATIPLKPGARDRSTPLRRIRLRAAAAATLAKAREFGIDVPERSDSKYSVGLGVEARVNGYYVHLGSQRFLRENGISIACVSRTCRNADSNGRSSLMLAALWSGSSETGKSVTLSC